MRWFAFLALLIAGPATAQLTNPGPPYTPEEAAFRAGRAVTASTGEMTVASGNVGCLYLQNTGTNTIFITHRVFTTNLPQNVVQPTFFGIANPTGNLPPSTVTPTGRNGSVTIPGLVVRGGVSTAANQPTGTVGAGNVAAGGYFDLGPGFERTLLPGASFANCIKGAATGIAGSADEIAVITATIYYE